MNGGGGETHSVLVINEYICKLWLNRRRKKNWISSLSSMCHSQPLHSIGCDFPPQHTNMTQIKNTQLNTHMVDLNLTLSYLPLEPTSAPLSVFHWSSQFLYPSTHIDTSKVNDHVALLCRVAGSRSSHQTAPVKGLDLSDEEQLNAFSANAVLLGGIQSPSCWIPHASCFCLSVFCCQGNKDVELLQLIHFTWIINNNM